MNTWADKVRHEDPIINAVPNPIPLGWVRLKKDKITGLTVMDQNENDPYLAKTPIDLNDEMSKAICTMRKRWEMHHYLQGTYYDYDIPDDPDEYDSDTDGEESESESDDEQNMQLAGGYRYCDDN